MKRYIGLTAALMLTLSAAAQNLNPTVQVTNAYDGKLMDISRKEIEMNVPDSLFRFDWDFNYSVFDNPYKGAYEFNPYVIDMRPDPAAYDGTRLYIRACAGYALHPEAQIVWNPQLKGRFGISVYDDFKAYFGNYTDISRKLEEDGSGRLVKGDAVRGSDMSNRLGAELRFDLPKAILTLDTGLDFIMTAGADSVTCFYSPVLVSNTAIMNQNILRARSNDPASRLAYDLAAHFDILTDVCKSSPGVAETRVSESSYGGDLRLGYTFPADYELAVYGDLNIFRPSAAKMPYATLAEMVPVISLSRERLHLETGVRLSKLWREAEWLSAVDESFQRPDAPRRLFFPHLKLDYALVPDALVFFADLSGGRKYNSFGNYLQEDHFFGSLTDVGDMALLSDATVTAFDASLGISGRIGHRLQYRLDGGYARMFNAPVQGIGAMIPDLLYGLVLEDAGSMGPSFFFYRDMADYDLHYADFKASWLSDRLEIMTDMRLQNTDFRKSVCPATLPKFCGSALFRYNWNRRVYAGITAEWATERQCHGGYEEALKNVDQMTFWIIGPSECVIPGWIDLGLSLDYRVNSRFSVWAKGGNLLNQMVLKNLLIAERGPYFSLGLSMNF